MGAPVPDLHHARRDLLVGAAMTAGAALRFGTKGGLATDEAARVLDTHGQVIPGLYAIGNNAASVMGPSYPGAGSTLAPAMTFGLLAVQDCLGGPAEMVQAAQ